MKKIFLYTDKVGKGKNILIAFSDYCAYFFCCTETPQMLVSMNTEKPSVNFSYLITWKYMGLCCILNESLPVHNFVASCKSFGKYSFKFTDFKCWHSILLYQRITNQNSHLVMENWQLHRSRYAKFSKIFLFETLIFYCQQTCVMCYWVSSDS